MFKLTSEQLEKLEAWLPEVYARAAAKSSDPLQPDQPYYGAAGGGLTYSFTPTGLGVCLSVKEALTGEEINLTDYKSW